MHYIRLCVKCDAAFTEILMAEIAEAGFNSFIETESGFEAYTDEDETYNTQLLESILQKYQHIKPFETKIDKVEKENWNEKWENSFDPIIVDDIIYIRAHFHPVKNYPYVITITPKMSFGTGHHETTYLMLKSQLNINHKNKVVMDAGCGTAILAIMASKLGARSIEAFDIDEWSAVNGNENTTLNQVDNVSIRQGKISTLTFDQPFDIILANINKNILLEEMPLYAQHLAEGGNLLLSGFYESDVAELEQRALEFALRKEFQDTRNNWATIALKKHNQ
jgi:ribosomal protein L11 methyltransferase